MEARTSPGPAAGPGPEPLVSVVVPTRNSAATLGECLRSLREQDHPALEIVVVDNSSEDPTQEIARELADVVLVGGPERSAQRNQGLARATGTYVLWIDSDMVLDRDVVSAAVAAAQRDDADAVFIRETSFGEGYWTACRRLERLCYLGEPLIEAPRLVRRSFFAEEGGFDPSVAGQEDAELRMRLLAGGHRLTRSEGEIRHREGRLTLRGIVEKRLYYGRSIPSYAAAAPGAVRAQGLATARALLRHRYLLLSDPVHGAGVVVMRLVEAAAYAYGAHAARREQAAAAVPGPGAPTRCEACGSAVRARPVGRGSVLYECVRCGHLHRDLALCDARARTHPWGGRQSFDRLRLGLTYRQVRRGLPRTSAPRVLELGFGTGGLLRRFLDDGAQVAGVDRDLLDLEVDPVVRARGELQVGRIEDMDPGEGRFDLVYGIHVVEHLDEPARAFSRALQALRPGGRLFLMTPDGTSLGLRLFRGSWWNLEDPTHVRFFTPQSLTTMLEAAGFRDVRVERAQWDSVTIEPSSLLRAVVRRPEEHGVLGRGWTRAAVLALTPAAAAARLALPRLAATMRVTATRPA